jgi:hypothetical protein
MKLIDQVADRFERIAAHDSFENLVLRRNLAKGAF